ncbi:small ubiquitin-related modifier 1-like [Hibiscus syriacus]|uniref:Small ubiquitin-related modifier 1-like n=1 Tax=Hibiscus syriacus TaxID=106335 RepID=A0A6A3CGY7_HIBSY|nr:small ubiquitin-related modifier 1-like [Hibiscus syriacus]
MILMEKHDDERSVFPLTSLQIGDLQSYLSDLSLFLATGSNKFYILVHNRPWLRDLGSWPAHLWWQLMVTKSRLSPFANTKGRRERKEGKEAASKLNADNSKKFERWFCFIDAATLSKKRALLPVKKLRTSLLLSSELHRTLYGFIVFEVTWSDVRGINYFNELQTDTSLAIEAKFMRRWEFESFDHAVNSISSWFSGTELDQHYLEEYLNSTIEVFYDIEEDFDEDDDEKYEDSLSTEESFSHDHCDTGDLKFTAKLLSHKLQLVLIREIKQVRFDDRDLPFKLQQIITPDQRLLRLLEAGLPSWVIFLQSYPGFAISIAMDVSSGQSSICFDFSHYCSNRVL